MAPAIDEFIRELHEDTGNLVVFCSDHGDNFGDHGLTRHIFCLYDSLIHVPMVVKPPADGDVPAYAGRAVDNQVSLVDLHPTFLEAAGATIPEYDLTESLLDFEDRKYHEYTFAEYAGFHGSIQRLKRKYPDFDAAQFAVTFQSVRDDDHKLIVDSDGGRELYAWRDDPGETTDLVEDHPAIADRLEGVIDDQLEPLDSPGSFETPDDPDLQAQLEDLGYI
jgi:arylsulfatase A-like enzyme